MLTLAAGAAAIESLDAVTFWKTFPIIFSYEPWFEPGPPLYLMGNPQYMYNNHMWSEFVSEFKSDLSARLSQADHTTLCYRLSPTVQSHLQIGALNSSV